MSEATTPEPTPYGAWPSPITAARLVEGAAAPGELRVDGADIWWSEARPAEGGRTQLIRRTGDGQRADLLPAGRNARTRVHEYGGGAWAVRDRVLVWNDWADQRLWTLEADAPTAEPHPLTPEPVEAHGWRHADVTWTPDGRWLLCVREAHGADAPVDAPEAVNTLVAVPADGSAAHDPSAIVTLVTGPDFVSSPVLRADGRWIAWLQWDHPQMPWDGTELWAARFDPLTAALSDPRRLAGGPTESIVAPGWLADGTLVACTDRDGWWTPVAFRALDDGGLLPDPEPFVNATTDAARVEIGGPQWVFGERWWAELDDGTLAVAATAAGRDHLAVIRPGTPEVVTLEVPFTAVHQVVALGRAEIGLIGATPTAEAQPVRVRLEGGAVGDVEVLRSVRDLGIGAGWLSPFEAITFPTSDGAVAHALYYRPCNPEVVAPAGERPPLLVLSHGGPTAAARPQLDLAKQLWTSRGFAVVDVNYRGSTGYGRPFRDALRGQWGIVDVEDCVAAARFLAEAGEVDPARLAIRGGSAGGYTTLCALAFHDTFAAGASHYGVADLAALARDTHKFEARYLDGLVGPWPEAADVYAKRSPIEHLEGFDRPLIVLQGAEDEVVPPNQAEAIVAALAAKGVPHAYVLFEGEQHGFRQAANIVRALEAELWFYGQVFGFTPADDIEPVAGATLR